MATILKKSDVNAGRCENPVSNSCAIRSQTGRHGTKSIASRIARVNENWSKQEKMDRRQKAAFIQNRLAELILCAAR